MAIRFIIGRAGTGKTHHCVEALARALADNPLGPPLIWLVPEQATFNAERMLVTHPQVRGTMGVTVAGFRRLSHLVALDLGISQGNHLDDIGRVLLLQDVVQKTHRHLRLFNKVADRPGFIANLDRMLRELQQHGHTPLSLHEVSVRLVADRTDPVLADKLSDLATLLHAWQQALADRHLDPDLLQQSVADRLGESPLVRRARVWVDAFSALNLLEIRTLVALAQTAASVDITLLADPISPGIADPLVPLDPLSPFLRTDRLYRRLTKTFTAANIPILPPLLITDNPPHRFARTPALARIERDLFLPEPPLDPDPAPPAGLHLLECANPDTEVHAAAQHIRRLIAQDPTLRYRDIGLIIPDLEGYQDAVRRVFTHHRIPHFIDLRRPITHHPLVELLRSAVSLPLGGFSTDDLVLLTKTSLTNIPEGDANILENYLLGHGITHHNLAAPFIFAEQNQSDDDDETPLTQAQKDYLAHVNQIRHALHTALAPWFAIATHARQSSADGPTGSALTRALFDLLQRFDVESKMLALMQQARDSNNEELHLIHQQAWRQIINLLETLDRTVCDRPTTLADFSRLLSVALESLTLGLIPPTVDQVLVSSVARSRHPEMRIAFILGAVESRFPLIRSEDPLLNDYQRDLFNKSSESPIGHGTADELLESKLFDCIAFTRAHEQLVVSYPIADQKGRAVVRSQYIARLRALFPGLAPQLITAVEEHSVDRLSTRDDLLAAILRWGRSHITQAAATVGGAPRAPAHLQNESRMTAAYDWLIASSDAATQTVLARAWPSLQRAQTPQLTSSLAAQLHGNNLRMSVSQLERFGSCPLQYFMHYTLGLRPRTELLLDSLNLGILYHRILERVFDCIIAGDLPWPRCDEQSLRNLLDRQATAAAEELHAELAQNSPEYAKMLQRARRNLGIALVAQRRAAAAGHLRPAATELVFGRPNDSIPTTNARKISLPVLSITTPGHRTVGLNGKIDRIDISPPQTAGGPAHAAVIDYKSSSTHVLRLYELYYGLALQLPIYMLVLRDQGREIAHAPMDPIAAFYVGLTQKRRPENDLTSLIPPGSDEFYQQTPPRGLIDASQISDLDSNIDEENRASDWYTYKRTKEGHLGKTGNDGVEHDDFSTILNFTRHKIAAMVDRLAIGAIAPNPYRARNDIPCTHCDFISVCPFDRINGDFRILNPMKPAEALDAMRREILERK
jgi:ATP-dependent helicase/nuclease subunit B